MDSAVLHKIEKIVSPYLKECSKTTPFAVSTKLPQNVFVNKLSFKGTSGVSLPINLNNLKKIVASNSGSNKRQTHNIWLMNGAEIGLIDSNQIVTNLTNTALQLLGLNPLRLSVETKLQNVILLGTGSSPFNFEKLPSCGESIRMVLQIPVEGGHEGGRTKVELQNRIQLFDTQENSDTDYYLTAFYSGCRVHLEEVTFGYQMAMIFDVSIEWLSPPGAPNLDLDTYLIVDNLRQTVDRWSELTSLPFFFVLLLEHDYTDEELKFSKLKGNDRHLAVLFSSVGNVDVRISNMKKREIATSREENIDSQEETTIEVLMEEEEEEEEEDEEELILNDWIGMDDERVDFQELLVDIHTQLVRFSRNLFGKPLENDCGTECSNQSVLLIWPANRSLKMMLRCSFTSVLDRLEQLPDADTFHQVVKFCSNHPARVWMDVKDREERTLRLLKIAIRLSKCRHSGLILLNSLAENYRSLRIKDHLIRDQVQYEGIRSRSIARAVAKLIVQIGYDGDCRNFLRKLITINRAISQMENYGHLFLALMDCGCQDGGRQIGTALCSMLFSSVHRLIRRLSVDDLVVCTGIIFRMQEIEGATSFRLRSFANLLRELTVSKLFYIVSGIQRSYPDSCPTFQREFHRHLVATPLTEEIGADVVLFFLRLNDAILLKELTVNLIERDDQSVIERIVASSAVWSAASASLGGQWALRLFVNKRIGFLQSMDIPQFTWAQNTTADIDDEVGSFLRSASVRNSFVGFESASSAREWTEQHFGMDQVEEFGHSARVSIEMDGGTVSCVVTKTKDLFYAQLNAFHRSRIELVALLDRKRRRLPNLEEDLDVQKNGKIKF